MEEDKKQAERRLKSQFKTVDGQLKTLVREVEILHLRLKEKDQEVKLNDFKIKELRKQIPNTRLKPLRKGNVAN